LVLSTAWSRTSCRPIAIPSRRAHVASSQPAAPIASYSSKFDNSGLYLGCEITWHAVERGVPVKAVGYDVGGTVRRTGSFADSAHEQFIPHPGPVFSDPMNVTWIFTVDGQTGATNIATFHQDPRSGCSPA